MAAILIEIDANELNNMFASRHFIIFKIGKISNYLSSSEYSFVTPIRQLNSHAFVSPNDNCAWSAAAADRDR